VNLVITIIMTIMIIIYLLLIQNFDYFNRQKH